MFLLSKCRYIIDPNSTIVELMLNHSRTFEKLEVFGRYRTRRTDTALVAPTTPQAGAASGLHRPLGYLRQLKRYLSSSFDIIKISLGLFCCNTTANTPRLCLRVFGVTCGIFSNVLVRFHIQLLYWYRISIHFCFHDGDHNTI